MDKNAALGVDVVVECAAVNGDTVDLEMITVDPVVKVLVEVHHHLQFPILLLPILLLLHLHNLALQEAPLSDVVLTGQQQTALVIMTVPPIMIVHLVSNVTIGWLLALDPIPIHLLPIPLLPIPLLDLEVFHH
jgi:hypothetical protein